MDILRVEKRLVLVAVMVLAGVLIVVGPNSGEVSQSSFKNKQESALSAKVNYLAALSKISGSADWKPKGWGSGEYLTTIPKIKAGAVVDLDSGEVFWSMNLREKIAPASLSKVATVMTALDVAPRDRLVDISAEAAGQIPTKLGLAEGEKLTLEEAVSAAILTSANDATEAIAQGIGRTFGGNTSTFMELVNKKVEKIGAADSHFETATGLDSDNQVSTVYDLVIIAHEAKKYDFIREVASLDYKKLPADNNHRMIDLPNWNALLGTYPGVNGLKIGYTEKAGHVTMVTASREGKNLLAVVVGAKSIEDREMAAATLLNYGFEKAGVAPYPLASIDLVKRFDQWKSQLAGKADEEAPSNAQTPPKKTPKSYGGTTPKTNTRKK